MGIQEDLKNRLRERGIESAVVSARHVGELQSDLRGHLDRGSLDADFYKERLVWFTYKAPATLEGPPGAGGAVPFKAASLIVAAVPRPQTRVTFRRNGAALSFLVPPTYSGGSDIADSVTALCAEVLSPAGFRTVPARIPNKLLAVRSGLAEYGLNNITYVRGMGSFHELVPLYSDMPCDEDGWREPVVMKACAECRACAEGCPTGAIDAGRFLLHGERCLVHHNERDPKIPFPSWIDPSWHECPVGCMKCQRVCPKNRAVLGFMEEGADFSEEETEALRAGTLPEAMGETIIRKLKRAGLADYRQMLPRNLSVLFD